MTKTMIGTRKKITNRLIEGMRARACVTESVPTVRACYTVYSKTNNINTYTYSRRYNNYGYVYNGKGKETG